MYQELLKKFSDQNPERFNEDFIRSKGSDDVVKEVTSIFKQLEVIKEIHVDDVSLDTHEENFGPIKQQGSFYKSLMPSRLIKIHYKVHIDGLAHPISKDMYLPKMLDDCFYINEGVRFYPIWQIVDNLSYATNNGVSLKSLMMPITIIANDKIVANTENGKGVVTVPDFCALIFSKKVSPLFYYMCKLSLDSLDAAGISVYDDIDKYETYKDETLIDKFNAYFGLHLKFADDPTKLYGENKSVFKLVGKKEEGLSFSISTDELNTNIGKIVVGMLVGAKTRDKKGFTNKLPFVFSYDNLICPWFWVDSLINASGFSRSDDAYKRYEKVRGVYVSLSRIIDSETKKSLPLKEKDKSDVFAIMKYLMLNFDSLFNADSQNLHNKRVRLYEYILYPLRVYFGQHINRIINMQINRTAESISKIFTSLTPMFLMKNLVTSQLLRTYNSTNDYDLFSAYLKGTFKGPQALGKGVSLEQRDINPSYVGRIGLAAASPGDPGVTFTFSPFVKTYDGYFDKDALEKTKQ